MNDSANEAAPRPPRFRNSTIHEIPSPGIQSQRPPRYVITLVVACMIGLGIAIEVALHISRTQNGFYVPEKNVFSFASTQFLTSFFPTLLVVPLAFFWSIADWMLRWYQPYITLAEGSAPASPVLFYSFKYKHYLVYISTVTALIVTLLQPLAGSLLEVQQVPHSVVSTAISTRAVALSPDVTQLDAYLASAGVTKLNLFGQTTTPLKSPSPTRALLTSPSELLDGSQQYSVINASSFVFWYYLQDTSATNDPQVSAIFCQPSMRVFTMSTSMNLGNGTLGDCTILQNFTEPNNVTGDPLNSQIFNGVVFDEPSNIYVAARAIAINSGLPGTVYKYAPQQPNGIQSVFDDPYGWLNATSKIYTQHLAVAAQANYFGQTNTTIPALLITDAPRLFVECVPSSALATFTSLMFLIGIAGLIVHLLHARSRRKLWLTSPPGSIASILLLPYDDESRNAFHLDQRTGAIVAEEGRGFDASGWTVLPDLGIPLDESNPDDRLIQALSETNTSGNDAAS
ncbi:hypothetical protein F5J12DRAFT_905161 [Pisolithus orientalis]|uniref:uncharacterized protein n=1 Tax=Pisolithus orientalis TaxID=936130 RepID=UPI002225338D|nr:uncharacterized protein F5J12DRAFT_905161 [Pisolithus orientalis]KAI6008774.1 hypothetical protein F5J12DRAFT_905161 [Pisolithus orientalis]